MLSWTLHETNWVFFFIPFQTTAVFVSFLNSVPQSVGQHGLPLRRSNPETPGDYSSFFCGKCESLMSPVITNYQHHKDAEVHKPVNELN